MSGEVNSITYARYEKGELCLTVDSYNASVLLIVMESLGYGLSIKPNPFLERNLASLQSLKKSGVERILRAS